MEEGFFFPAKNIHITLERGYIMGFIGPNGAGKSTTIKLMMNLTNLARSLLPQGTK